MGAAFDWIRDHKLAFFAMVAAVMLAATVGLPMLMAGSGGQAAADPDEAAGAPSADEERPDPSYGSEQLAILEVLEGARWIGAGGEGRLEVRDGELVETLPDGEGGSTERRQTFELGEVDGSAILSTEGVSQTDFVLVADDGSARVAHLIETDPAAAGEPGDPYWRFACDALSAPSGYTNLGAAADLAFEGIDDELVGAMGGDAAAIEGAIAPYVSVYHATSFLCTWDGILRLDYQARTAEADFTLTTNAASESAPPRITLKMDMDAGTFEVGDAS